MAKLGYDWSTLLDALLGALACGFIDVLTWFFVARFAGIEATAVAKVSVAKNSILLTRCEDECLYCRGVRRRSS